MLIPVPWPDPRELFRAPFTLAYACIETPPPAAPVWVLDLFREDGTFIEDWEIRLWHLKAQYPAQEILLHVTALPPALILPDTWGLSGLLIHSPTWTLLHGLPAPPTQAKVAYPLPPAWQCLPPDFTPPAASRKRLQHFLLRLQALRRALPQVDFSRSTLFYTVADAVTYPHFSLQELENHVATIRR